MTKNQSSKLWEVSSPSLSEKFFIRGKTQSEARKVFKEFLKSSSYWEQEKVDYMFAMNIFKNYTNYREIPGMWLDDTRGDVILELTNPGSDFIWNEKPLKNKNT